MPFHVNRTAPRPVGQTQQGVSVTGKADQRVAHSASSGVRRSSLFKQFMGSARLLMTRGLNFVSPGNIRADSKCRVSKGMARREVGQMLHALSTQTGDNVVRNRLDVQRALVELETTMKPMTSRGVDYDNELTTAVNIMAMQIKNNPDVDAAREQLDNILARLGEINAHPNESARITIVADMVKQVRARIPNLPPN